MISNIINHQWLQKIRFPTTCVGETWNNILRNISSGLKMHTLITKRWLTHKHLYYINATQHNSIYPLKSTLKFSLISNSSASLQPHASHSEAVPKLHFPLVATTFQKFQKVDFNSFYLIFNNFNNVNSYNWIHYI